jgi:hypothetical protein
MLPWASPLEGLFPWCRGHWSLHRARCRSTSSVLPGRAEARPFGCGVLGRRCLLAEACQVVFQFIPRRGGAGAPRGVQVRAPLTRPPSWLAPCPAGCPAGVRAPPTRPAPAPEGVSTPGADARYHIQWLSASWSRGDPVALSPTSLFEPEGSSVETVPVRGPSGSSGAFHPRVSRSGSSVPCPSGRPRPAGAGGRVRLVRRCARPKRWRAVRSRGAWLCDLSWFPRRPFVVPEGASDRVAASRLAPVRGGVPRRSGHRGASIAVARLSGVERRPARLRRSLWCAARVQFGVWRRLEGVTVCRRTGPPFPSPGGEWVRLVAVVPVTTPIPFSFGFLRIAPEVAERWGFG